LDYQPDNEDMQQFLTSALQSEIDKRHLNRQMRALQQAGFPTKKRFEDLLMDDLPQDGREAIPELKTLAFLKERRNVILIGNSGTGKTRYGNCGRDQSMRGEPSSCISLGSGIGQ